MADDPTKPPAGVTAESLLADGGSAGPSEADMLAGDDDAQVEDVEDSEQPGADDAEGDEIDDAAEGDDEADEGEDPNPEDGEAGEVADLSAIELEDDDEPETPIDPATIAIEDDPEFKDVPASITEAVGKFKELKPDRVANAITVINKAVELEELPDGVGKALAEVLEEVQELIGSETVRRQMVKRDSSRAQKRAKAELEQKSVQLDRLVDTLGLDSKIIGTHGARGDAQKAIVGKLIKKAFELHAAAKASGKKLPEDKAFFLDAARRLKISGGTNPAPARPASAASWGKVAGTKPAKTTAQPTNQPRRQRLTGIDLEAKLLSGG